MLIILSQLNIISHFVNILKILNDDFYIFFKKLVVHIYNNIVGYDVHTPLTEHDFCGIMTFGVCCSTRSTMEKKLLIFDLDGTLADTIHTIRDAVNMCMEHFGYPTLTYTQTRDNVGFGARELIRRSLPPEVAESKEKYEEIFEYFTPCYRITHDKIDGCYDGLYEVVCELYRSGFELAVLSNKPDALVGGIVKKLFPDGMFKIAQGQTELPKKPDPTVPVMIAKQLGYAPSDTYFIGDSEVDVLTAKNAGMHSVAVSWGFRSREVLENSAPDVIVDTPDELLRFFAE